MRTALSLAGAALAGCLAVLPPLIGGDVFPNRAAPHSAAGAPMRALATRAEVRPSAVPQPPSPAPPPAVTVELRPGSLFSRPPPPIELPATLPLAAVEPAGRKAIAPQPDAATPAPRQPQPLETELLPDPLAPAGATTGPQPPPEAAPAERPPAAARHG